ncbi:hypothetical protein PR048_029110 [Dryococelus australis]|uniref:Uncharacterized protein n=1 Tax=Dryococelus australis TaxID=614101 RepID=A0ABQ9GCH3_9NEOP|nr:hypothetical protein PR048_029110 [Dryococelus australis]
MPCFPVVLLVAVAMFGANVITPSEIRDQSLQQQLILMGLFLEYTTESLLYLLFWGAMVAVTFGTIMIYGPEFVDYPKLQEIKKATLTD